MSADMHACVVSTAPKGSAANHTGSFSLIILEVRNGDRLQLGKYAVLCYTVRMSVKCQ